MTRLTLAVLLVTVLVAFSNADIYMQNMRGSNNRLKGRNRNRDNANRLFDSQNNARGGYNVGGNVYYAGSELTLEWTNQHECGGENTHCEITFQYMCSDKLRNGERETTIPQDPAQCENDDCDTDLQYGMHENFDYYERCFTRQRNKGLYTSDQNMDGRHTARFTRQDNGGTRYGYECPEERDYYPYWHPTPWKDIAVLITEKDQTKLDARCKEYKEESQNQKEKGECFFDFKDFTANERKKGELDKFFRNQNGGNNAIPNNKEACEDYEVTYKGKTVKPTWRTVPAHNIPAPECLQAPYSRDNHLGNGIGGFPNTYNWTIPADFHDQCTLRIRYNISTGEFPRNIDASSNGRNRGNQPCKACAINLGDQLGIDEWDAQDRGYILTGNPDIHPFAVNGVVQEKFELKLAINTDQYGRTFEDRSHMFAIRKRPDNVPANAKIYNINVKGKRGNIVQTYPATEYDFHPNRLTVNQNDYVHVAWTGSDDNPQNNAGQGEAGTDRSNIVLLGECPANYKYCTDNKAKHPDDIGRWGRSYPLDLAKNTFLGFSEIDAINLAMAGPHTGGDIEELDENGPNFDLGLRQCKKPGTYRYLCTRNNNFTNRGQKAVVIVEGAKKDESTQSNDTNEALNDIEAEMANDVKMANM